MNKTDDLRRQFAVPDRVNIVDITDHYPAIEIHTDRASALIALHGAHVMRYQPHGEAPLLWLSNNAIFQQGKAIRGGVPICWPWFGKHPSDTALPAHGFARTRMWTLDEVLHSGESCRVTLSLKHDQTSLALWPYVFDLSMTITISDQLGLALCALNSGDDSVSYTAALHTYYHVGDISRVTLAGLENTDYIDAVLDNQRFINQRCMQAGKLRFDGEIDRVYQRTEATVLIEDACLKRRIRVEKRGSASTVIWNPWSEKAQQMNDFDSQGYQHMLCVETANVGDQGTLLEPGQSHTLEAISSLEPF